MRGRFVPSSCIRAMPSPHTAGVKVALRSGARIVIRHSSDSACTKDDMSLSHLCRFHVWVNRGRRGRRKRRRASLFVLPFHVGVPWNDGFMISASPTPEAWLARHTQVSLGLVKFSLLSCSLLLLASCCSFIFVQFRDRPCVFHLVVVADI
jgi:hypothetical protein